ncbi:uncharacterized protein TNCV_4304081 [Trichonephila clavipes]|nr:uncharacterized protein TNCV_4304081 [Trichonephila clavipes]
MSTGVISDPVNSTSRDENEAGLLSFSSPYTVCSAIIIVYASELYYEQCQEKRKGADLSRSTSKARNLRNSRSERTEEQIQQQNTDARVRMAQLHQEEPEDTRAETQ